MTCTEGHSNPDGWEFCAECGAPLDEPEDGRWYRAGWVVVGASAVVALMLTASIVTLVLSRHSDRSGAPTSDRATAVEKWWGGAHESVTDLQTALDDTRRALGRRDRGELKAACQRMHDAAAVDIQSHLPSPDPFLTGMVRAAVEDAHTAAHMCLSVLAGTSNSYDAEFVVSVEQVDRQLAAARVLIDRALTSSP